MHIYEAYIDTTYMTAIRTSNAAVLYSTYIINTDITSKWIKHMNDMTTPLTYAHTMPNTNIKRE